MTTILDLAENLESSESLIEIPASTPVAQARTKLQEARARFVMVTEGGNPQTLVVEKDLASLNNEQQSTSLGSVLNRLPPLVVIDRASTVLDVEDLKLLSVWLQRTKSPGVVVYQNDGMLGVVSRRTIAHALPLSAIPPASRKGDIVVPDRSYICRKCEKDDPPASPILSQGGRVPKCRKHPFEHGAHFMEIFVLD